MTPTGLVDSGAALPEIDPAISPYLQGFYAPVRSELDVDGLEVTGSIPPALDGTYIRNGFNPAFPPLGDYHVFDGDGMLHAVDLRDGRASYRNRWVLSRGLLAECRAGRALYGGLAQFAIPDPQVVAEGGFMKNTANTNIVAHAGRFLALMEAAPPTEVTRELDTIGEYDFAGRLAGPMTAHPKFDPVSGEMHFFGYTPIPPHLRYHVADRTGALVRTVEIDLPRPVMMHDFVVTERHVLFFDLPAVFDLPAAMQGGPMVSWRPEHGARLGVLPREATTDETRWFEIEPCYVFHFLNAWDDTGPDGRERIVVDGCRAPGLALGLGGEQPRPQRPTLHRWTVDPAAGTVRVEPRDDRWADFPRFDERLAGRRTRYGYLAQAASWEATETRFSAVRKLDLDTGEATVADLGEHCHLGEPLFVPDPDGDAEDDGWVLAFAWDRVEDRSDLVILDARDPAAGPVARVHLPQRVPFGAHGNWFPR